MKTWEESFNTPFISIHCNFFSSSWLQTGKHTVNKAWLSYLERTLELGLCYPSESFVAFYKGFSDGVGKFVCYCYCYLWTCFYLKKQSPLDFAPISQNLQKKSCSCVHCKCFFCEFCKILWNSCSIDAVQ